MQTIRYRIQFTGALSYKTFTATSSIDGASYETVTVQARNINSGYAKVLKIALEPLGNGARREIGAIEFLERVG